MKYLLLALSVIGTIFLVNSTEIPVGTANIELRNPFPNCLVGQSCSPHDPLVSCQTIVHYNGCTSEICSECHHNRVKVVLNSNDTVEWADLFWHNAEGDKDCSKSNSQLVSQFRATPSSMRTQMDTLFEGTTCGLAQTFDPKGFQGVVMVREYLAGFEPSNLNLQYISYTNVTIKCCAQSEVNSECEPIKPLEEDVKHCAVQTFSLVPGHTAADLPVDTSTPQDNANKFKFHISMSNTKVLEDERVSWYVQELTASCEGNMSPIKLIEDGAYTAAASALQISAQRPEANRGSVAFTTSAFHCCGESGGRVRFDAKVEFCQIGDVLDANGCVKTLCSSIPSYGRFQASGHKMLPESFVVGPAEMEAGKVVLTNQL